jgi:hypothetical protein
MHSCRLRGDAEHECDRRGDQKVASAGTLRPPSSVARALKYWFDEDGEDQTYEGDRPDGLEREVAEQVPAR